MRAIGKHEWLEGGAEYEKYKSAGARRKLEGDIVAEMDAIFATKPLAEWGPLFDAEGVWWCPVQDPEEVAADEQAIAAGACVSPSASWLLSPVGRQPTCRLFAQQLCSVRSEPGSNSVGCADSLTSQPAKRTRRPAARTSSPSRRPSTSSAAPPPRASPVRPNAS